MRRAREKYRGVDREGKRVARDFEEGGGGETGRERERNIEG